MRLCNSIYTIHTKINYFFEIQSIYKLPALKQINKKIIQYLIFDLTQVIKKNACLEVLTTISGLEFIIYRFNKASKYVYF